ncbi:phage integrase N-terminal SAM-like domain-containing protein [uncultured Intestinibacter sp.]|uniref:phage integrase SAM-like domain-containing protein n=1 Tax=uncultured Intestinibacter sp. TaxID=1505659 RepID=UPI0034DD2C27
MKISNDTERKIKRYKNKLNKFFTYCKNKHELLEIEEITHFHIKQYLKQPKSKGLNHSYINTILKNIRSFYNDCYKEPYCLNIAKKVEFLREKS